MRRVHGQQQYSAAVGLYPEVFEDFSTKEELLTLLPLKTTTRGVDIYNAVKEFFVQKRVALEKLVAVTTDGAPAAGFIAHCKGDADSPKLLHYHCIIHQQALCARHGSRCENHKQRPLQSEAAQDIQGAIGGDVSRIWRPAATHRNPAAEHRTRLSFTGGNQRAHAVQRRRRLAARRHRVDT